MRNLEEVKDITLSVTSYEDNSDIRSKNVISDKVGKQAIENLDLESDLRKQLNKIKDEIIELNFKVEEVDMRLEGLRRKEREILIDYYIEGNSYEHIGNTTYHNLFGQTRSTDCIKKIIANSLEKISKL